MDISIKNNSKYSIAYENYIKKYNCDIDLSNLEFKNNFQYAINNGIPIDLIIDSIVKEFNNLINIENNNLILSNINKNSIPCYITFRNKKTKLELHHAFLIELKGNETYGNIISNIIIASIKNIIILLKEVKKEEVLINNKDKNELSLYTKLVNESRKEITYYYKLYSNEDIDKSNNNFYETFYK